MQRREYPPPRRNTYCICILYMILFIDTIGYYGPVILFAITFYFLLLRSPYLIAFVIGYVINTFLNSGLKLVFREPRPKGQIEFIDHTDLTGANYYGFPSGHAQASFFALAYIFFVNGPPAVLYFMTGICTLTIYQRWKYRRHSMKQLFFGALIGTGFAYIVAYSVQYYLHMYKNKISIL